MNPGFAILFLHFEEEEAKWSRDMGRVKEDGHVWGHYSGRAL